MQNKRFPENSTGVCYLSMSERVIDWHNNTYNCSHLYRDKINHITYDKHKCCLYGCNRRLVMFNQYVQQLLDMT